MPLPLRTCEVLRQDRLIRKLVGIRATLWADCLVPDLLLFGEPERSNTGAALLRTNARRNVDVPGVTGCDEGIELELSGGDRARARLAGSPPRARPGERQVDPRSLI